MAIYWDEEVAIREGWSIFDVDEKTEIQRIDCPDDNEYYIGESPPTDPTFSNDEEALAFVIRRAKEGSELHLEALRMHCLGCDPHLCMDVGDKRILNTKQIDRDEDDQERVTEPGMVVEIVDFKYEFDNGVFVGCPANGANWFFSIEEWLGQTDELSNWPFATLLKSDRQAAIEILMERKITEWMASGSQEAVFNLVQWVMRGLNLGDDEVILKLAEGVFDV